MNDNKNNNDNIKENVRERLALTAEVVAAHVSNNKVDIREIPSFIHEVYSALAKVEKQADEENKRPVPAVPIHKSVGHDYITCLEDGKRLKMLKRHLRTAYNMTPEEYRSRWGLSIDYPMVAPAYAKQRSELAKTIGLGKRGRKRASA